MTIKTATFAVQRGTTQYGVKGDDVGNKLAAGDVLAVSRGGVTKHFTYDGSNINDIADTDLLACTDTDGVTYSVTGDQFKSLFTVIFRVGWTSNNGIPQTEIYLENQGDDVPLQEGTLDWGSTITQLDPPYGPIPIVQIFRSGTYWMIFCQPGNKYNGFVSGAVVEFVLNYI